MATQVVAAGRRRFFYVYHLASGRVERVARVQGMDEDRSLESFAASPAQGESSPELAFLGNSALQLHVASALQLLVMSGSVVATALGPVHQPHHRRAFILHPPLHAYLSARRKSPSCAARSRQRGHGVAAVAAAAV